MSRLLASLGAVVGSACLIFGVEERVAAQGPEQATPLGIAIVKPLGPVMLSPGGKVSVEVKVTGMKFASGSISGKAKSGFGQVHFYIDRIPAGGYTAASLAANPIYGWAGAFASSATVFDLKKSAVRVPKGEHLLLVALARTDHVLYQAPAAAIVFTVK